MYVCGNILRIAPSFRSRIPGKLAAAALMIFNKNIKHIFKILRAIFLKIA